MADTQSLLRAAATRMRECADISKDGDSCERGIDDAMKIRPGSLERIGAAIAAATKEKGTWTSTLQESQKLIGQLNADKSAAAVDAGKKLDAAMKSANTAVADITKKINEATKFQTQQQSDEKEIEKKLEKNLSEAQDAIGSIDRQIEEQLQLRRRLDSGLATFSTDKTQAGPLAQLLEQGQDGNRELEQAIRNGERIYKEGGEIIPDAMASFTNKLRESAMRLDRLHNDLDKSVRKGKDSVQGMSRGIMNVQDALTKNA